jgi:hypothetical protein
MFNLKTVKSSLRNVAFYIKYRVTDNFQNCDNYINVLWSKPIDLIVRIHCSLTGRRMQEIRPKHRKAVIILARFNKRKYYVGIQSMDTYEGSGKDLHN